MNKAFYQKLDRAVALASEHERELLAYPGVVTVGAGPERRAGKLSGEAAVVVTVRKKRSRVELEELGQRLLPSRLGDIPVDVIVLGVPVEAPEIVAAQERARKVLEKVQARWLATENVTGIGIGYKRVGGEPDFNQIALQIFVATKLPLAEVRRRKLTEVPPRIDGVVTDVVEQPVLRPTGASGSRDDRRDPLVGGLTVGVNTKPFWYGTLGAIVYDRTSGAEMVLSNQHVLDGPVGTEVVQPSPIGLDDSLEISFQLDICNPIHFFRLDTPNTTVGTILSGAAAGAALAAALSDEKDPTRRGQEATVPPAGAKTLFETHEVKLDYPELPIPGTHFKVNTGWNYTRHTDAGSFAHGVAEVRENPHALADKLLVTDRRLYHPGDTIRLFGLILPEPCAPKPSDQKPGRPIGAVDLRVLTRALEVMPPTLTEATAHEPSPDQPDRTALASAAYSGCRCDRYFAVAVLTPVKVDRAFPVVLREPVLSRRVQLIGELLQLVRALDDERLAARVYRVLRYGCFYTGELTVGAIPMGPWRHYLFVQTVNNTPEGMDPAEAAKIIGGLPVSQNTRPTLDVACGPAVFEDGQFDIELI